MYQRLFHHYQVFRRHCLILSFERDADGRVTICPNFIVSIILKGNPYRLMLCPLCHRPLDPDLIAIGPKIEDHIARILREDRPGWKPQDSACPECVHEAVEKAIAARSITSLQAELLT